MTQKVTICDLGVVVFQFGVFWITLGPEKCSYMLRGVGTFLKIAAQTFGKITLV